MQWDEPADCTTPRGWLRYDLTEHPDYSAENPPVRNYCIEQSALCVGNYLSYEGTSAVGPNGEKIHATRYVSRVGSGGISNINRGSAWFFDIEAAKKFIAEGVISTGAQLALV